MYVYIVKSTELLNYIGHGLYNEAEYEHGIYTTNEQAKQRVKERQGEGLDAWVEKKEVKE